jgi:hypothetical protein
VADLYYIEEGYYDAGYFNYTASIDLVAFSNASVTTVAGKIVDVNDAYPYTWDDLTTWENFVSNQWAPSGVFVASAFTLTGTLIKLPFEGSATFNSQASLSISIQRLTGIVSNLSSAVNQSTVISKTAGASSTMSSAFTQTAIISHIEGVDLFALSDAAIAVEVSRIRDNNTAATAVFSIATDVGRIQQGDSDSDAVFSAIINGLRSRDVNLETQAAFSFDSTGNKIRFGASTITAETAVYCDATEITPFIDFEASFASEFTTQANCGKILQ